MSQACYQRLTRALSGLIAFLSPLVVLLLAGCGELPRPFLPQAKSLDLTSISYTTTVGLRPVEGAAPYDPYLMVTTMAEELSRQGLPVSTDPAVPTRSLLIPRATVRPGAIGREQVDIAWRLIDEKHTSRTLLHQSLFFPTGGWRNGESDILEAVARDAAPQIAREILGHSEETGPFPTYPGARLVVLPIQLAPGDARESLARALDTELRLASVPVARMPKEGDLLLKGQIITTPRAAGYQEVQITWIVLRAADESEVGRINQANRIVAGSLDGPWGSTATLVARGAVFGVMDLLTRSNGSVTRTNDGLTRSNGGAVGG